MLHARLVAVLTLNLTRVKTVCISLLATHVDRVVPWQQSRLVSVAKSAAERGRVKCDFIVYGFMAFFFKIYYYYCWKWIYIYFLFLFYSFCSLSLPLFLFSSFPLFLSLSFLFIFLSIFRSYLECSDVL